MRILNKIENPRLRELAEWVVTIIGAALLFMFLQAFVVKPAMINNNSMEPTFFHGERVLVLRFAYLFDEPDYGDIIAFPFKEDPNQKFIKRVIGRPGDVIDFEDFLFTVNGEAITDNYGAEFISSQGSAEYPLTVPDDSYFVLGDNRNASKDSRFVEVGCIPKPKIIGKVALRLWPLDKLGLIN